MPIISPSNLPTVTEIQPPWGQLDSVDGQVRVRVFSVIATSPENARIVLDATSAVRRGSVYYNYKGELVDELLLCREIEVRGKIPAPTGGFGLYEVTAIYAYPSVSYIPPLYGVGPRIRIERQMEMVTADVDRIGEAIVNQIGEPVDPPLSRIAVTRALIVDFMALELEWGHAYNGYALPYEGRVNSVAFYGHPARTLYMDSVTIGETNTHYGDTPWLLFRITARMPYKPVYAVNGQMFGGWTPAWLDKGWRYKDAEGNVVEHDGAMPVFLGAGGVKVDDPANAYVNSADLYNEVDFNERFQVF